MLGVYGLVLDDKKDFNCKKKGGSYDGKIAKYIITKLSNIAELEIENLGII